MNILFRVDASSQMGTGHLVRCFALAQALDQVEIRSIFLVDTQTQAFLEKLPCFDFQYITLEDAKSTTEVTQCAEQFNTDVLVIDGYHFSTEYRLALKQNGLYMVAIDDNNDLGELHASIIVNPSVYKANTPNYPKQGVKLLTGENYRLLRQEITGQLPVTWSKRSGIAIILGGSDPRALTLPVTISLIKVLNQQGISPDVNVIIGAAVSEQAELIKQLSSLKSDYPYLCWSINPPNIASILANKQLVISAAGGTQFELFALATPAILLAAYENQIANSQIAAEQGWAKVINVGAEFDELIFERVCKDVLNASALKGMHDKTDHYGDEGALNCALAIKSEFFLKPPTLK
ncbi:UDP-2,4-diacetamido-2,4,6-trideoxy-beta-L-altropyranose hydrolase [Catenovulum sp. SM1970]|uniref:UDP-2,4-diacetamido-2,4, 6-trideoxy-beta-L-altropyranose hydrolase n=1 Tax=Marinifaba aquimaris TaxID=2741323 RepID=UPI001572C19E|nr:UDP-2,4-diacetamido-2,4,6-trideoxy-beta-L-altropyranose hydrolase [Marinifaba aquimaris]